MSDELKSAWELALEKLESQEEMSVQPLNDEQREAIAEIRNQFKARIAETEISYQGRLRAAALQGSAEEVETLQNGLREEKARLNRQMERKIEKVRNEGAPE